MNIIHGKQEQLVVCFIFGLSVTLFIVKKTRLVLHQIFSIHLNTSIELLLRIISLERA